MSGRALFTLLIAALLIGWVYFYGPPCLSGRQTIDHNGRVTINGCYREPPQAVAAPLLLPRRTPPRRRIAVPREEPDCCAPDCCPDDIDC